MSGNEWSWGPVSSPSLSRSTSASDSDSDEEAAGEGCGILRRFAFDGGWRRLITWAEGFQAGKVHTRCSLETHVVFLHMHAIQEMSQELVRILLTKLGT